MDQAANKIGDAIGGGEKGEKTLSLTSLSTDKLISLLGKLVPALLLLFIKTFNSELFQSQSLACEPRAYRNFSTPGTTINNHPRYGEVIKSDKNNRFYFNEFCWNNLVDTHYEHKLDGSVDYESKEKISLQTHKYFPYFILCLIGIIAIPGVVWTSVAESTVQPKVETLLTNIQEALNITVEEIMSMMQEREKEVQDHEAEDEELESWLDSRASDHNNNDITTTSETVISADPPPTG